MHTQFALNFFTLTLGAVKGAPLHLNEERVEVILRLLYLVLQLFHVEYKIKVAKPLVCLGLDLLQLFIRVQSKLLILLMSSRFQLLLVLRLKFVSLLRRF